MGRATPLGPWETRYWPPWERPKKSIGVIASNASSQCDVKFTLRAAVAASPAFGIGQQRPDLDVSLRPGHGPLDEMIAVVSLRIIVLPALCLKSISIETNS